MENRKSRRRTVDRRGAVWSDGRGIPCIIVDVSATGCRVRMVAPQEVAQTVEIHLAGLSAMRPGNVVWQRGSEIGVHFTDEAAAAGA